MGSDRARVSFDPKQQYRSVVMQQGRVTLEADWNEAQRITGEELRKETLDIIGPSGTPDDGYLVVVPATPTAPLFDFSVNPGTMYVGGLRCTLPEAVTYSKQTEWLDGGPEDPDWVKLTALKSAPAANELVSLFLREQEVSAVEDPDLKDVALGGPDTAQRTRLVQRIVRTASKGGDCASGLAGAVSHWKQQGLEFDPATMRLYSDARLQVGAADKVPLPNPCQPQAQGGYVDPDNQLIRVQISSTDQQAGGLKFVWGFDDASFLYRIDVDPNNPQNLLFESAPVDSSRQPVSGQTVEILREAVLLPNGGEIAALSGFVVTLDQNYDPDAQSVVLPSGVSLPPDYLPASPSASAPLFLRVWQNEQVFTPGTAVALGDTGLQVTLTTEQGAPFHVGDYWMFAVRPATPQTVYPERYWNAPQRPDGPRIWICPLAVIAWKGQTGTVVSDCRNQFGPTGGATCKGGGCCTLVLSPADLTPKRTLQSVLDGATNVSMHFVAVDAGVTGNNIRVTVENLDTTTNPPTFDITVVEESTFSGATIGTLDRLLGYEASNSPNLAHVIRASVEQNPNGLPVAGQYEFSVAQTPSARANVPDPTGKVAFTLEAKREGTDGTLTTATVANVTAGVSPVTFDLTLEWTKTLPKQSMANFGSIAAGLAYEVVVTAGGSGSTLPSEGSTALAGGSAGNPAVVAIGNLYGGPVVICLRPGVYRLDQPLRILSSISKLTLEACGGGVTLAAVAGEERSLIGGMVEVIETSDITLRGLSFDMPLMLFTQAQTQQLRFQTGAFASIGNQPFELAASIGLLVADCNNLKIEHCSFVFPNLAGQRQDYAGIITYGECRGLTLEDNTFAGPPNFVDLLTRTGVSETANFLAGYLQFSSADASRSSGTTATGTALLSVLDDARMEGNRFSNLLAPVWIGCPAGTLSFAKNTIRSSWLGFVYASLDSLSNAVRTATAADETGAQLSRLAGTGILSGLSLAAAYPLPKGVTLRRAVPVSAAVESEAASTSPATAAATGAAQPSLTQNIAALLTAASANNPPITRVDFRFAENDIDALVSATAGGDTAIHISETDKNATGTLVMTGNTLRNSSSTAPTVAVEGVSRCVITGNLILNEETVEAARGKSAPPSLSVVPLPVQPIYAAGVVVSGVAIMGNVFRGQPTLPLRLATLPYGIGVLPAPFDHWEAYNTLI